MVPEGESERFREVQGAGCLLFTVTVVPLSFLFLLYFLLVFAPRLFSNPAELVNPFILVPLVIFLLLAMVMRSFTKQTVAVTDNRLLIKLRGGMFGENIPLSSISSVEVVPYDCCRFGMGYNYRTVCWPGVFYMLHTGQEVLHVRSRGVSCGMEDLYVGMKDPHSCAAAIANAAAGDVEASAPRGVEKPEDGYPDEVRAASRPRRSRKRRQRSRSPAAGRGQHEAHPGNDDQYR